MGEPAACSYDDVADSLYHLHLTFDASVDRIIGTDPGNPVNADLTGVDIQTEHMLVALTLIREKEAERNVNLVGAHRNNPILSLSTMLVRGYASHDESWPVALALRLGVFEPLSSDGDVSILILDDAFVEFDSLRREGLAVLALEAEQIIVICAIAGDLPGPLDHHALHVRLDPEHGTIIDKVDDG